MTDPDWTNPCAVAAWLKQVRVNITAGLQEQRIVYAGRDTTYFASNPDKLDALIAQYDNQCAIKTGARTGRRRAFRAG